MNRRNFGKTAALATVAAVIAPKSTAIVKTSTPDDWNLATPEQRVAIQYMYNHMPSSAIFHKVAVSIPQTYPDVTRKNGWNHGGHRAVGFIDGHSPYEFEDGKVRSDANLSDISYIAFWRQAARNKDTQEVKAFAIIMPCMVGGNTTPGASVKIGPQRIPVGTSDVDIEAILRDGFMKLQDMIRTYTETGDVASWG